MIRYLLLVFLAVFHFGTGQEDSRFDDPDILEPAPSDLHYAFIMFRHGIRAPIYNPFLSDEKFNEKFPEGIGALTEAGKRLMFHVGESLRTRYQSVLPDYDVNYVLVTSTPKARTKESAQCVASAMFPIADPIINDIPTWQPVPVYQSTLYDKNKLFDEVKGNTQCPRYIALRDSVINEEGSHTSKKQKEFYKTLSNKIKRAYPEYKPVLSLNDIFPIWDTHKMETLNLKSPTIQWPGKLMNGMERLAQIRMWSYMHAKTEMLQYYTGPLFHQLIKKMIDQKLFNTLKDLENDKKSKRVKLHLHGSHDITLCAMFWALTGQETYFAWAGDTIILEMYKNTNVKLFLYSPLNTNKKNRFKNISLKPLCGNDPCQLPDLKTALKDLTLDEDEWKLRCKGENIESANYRPLAQDFSKKSIDGL